jgi:hypothetical protein
MASAVMRFFLFIKKIFLQKNKPPVTFLPRPAIYRQNVRKYQSKKKLQKKQTACNFSTTTCDIQTERSEIPKQTN